MKSNLIIGSLFLFICALDASIILNKPRKDLKTPPESKKLQINIGGKDAHTISITEDGHTLVKKHTSVVSEPEEDLPEYDVDEPFDGDFNPDNFDGGDEGFENGPHDFDPEFDEDAEYYDVPAEGQQDFENPQENYVDDSKAPEGHVREHDEPTEGELTEPDKEALQDDLKKEIDHVKKERQALIDAAPNDLKQLDGEKIIDMKIKAKFISNIIDELHHLEADLQEEAVKADELKVTDDKRGPEDMNDQLDNDDHKEGLSDTASEKAEAQKEDQEADYDGDEEDKEEIDHGASQVSHAVDFGGDEEEDLYDSHGNYIGEDDHDDYESSGSYDEDEDNWEEVENDDDVDHGEDDADYYDHDYYNDDEVHDSDDADYDYDDHEDDDEYDEDASDYSDYQKHKHKNKHNKHHHHHKAKFRRKFVKAHMVPDHMFRGHLIKAHMVKAHVGLFRRKNNVKYHHHHVRPGYFRRKLALKKEAKPQLTQKAPAQEIKNERKLIEETIHQGDTRIGPVATDKRNGVVTTLDAHEKSEKINMSEKVDLGKENRKLLTIANLSEKTEPGKVDNLQAHINLSEKNDPVRQTHPLQANITKSEKTDLEKAAVVNANGTEIDKEAWSPYSVP